MEYFLARAMAIGGLPDLDHPNGLRTFLETYATNPIALAAGRLYFLLHNDLHAVLSRHLCTAIAREDRTLQAPSPRFDFLLDTFLDLLDEEPNVVSSVIEDVLAGTTAAEVDEERLRRLILIVTHLPERFSIGLLEQIDANYASVTSGEAGIFIADRLVQTFLEQLPAEPDLLRDEPFASYFAVSKRPLAELLPRLLGFVNRLGPDNLHPDELVIFRNAANSACDRILANTPATATDAARLVANSMQFCNRLFFNATKAEIERFYNNDWRQYYAKVLMSLEDGCTLTRAQYINFRPYVQRFGNNCEFHLAKLAFILSALNDFDATLDLWAQIFADFDAQTPPEEVDFLQATLLYMFVVNGADFDPRFDDCFERVLRDWPHTLLYAPGFVRSRWRRTADEFALVFEDGFNPVASYLYLRPSPLRKSLYYKNYRQQHPWAPIDESSLFTHYLKLESSPFLVESLRGSMA
jgi:hypothetical protein